VSTPQIPPGGQASSVAHSGYVAGGSSPDAHLAGLPPELVVRIRQIAAELAATAPPLTKDQAKALSAIFKPATASKKTAA
jgi:hypothetical protein